MPYPEITAIIPASGKGKRFGRPKAQATKGDKTFAEHISGTLREAGVEQIVVAAGHETADMLSTLREAIRALPPGAAKGYLIWPVDHPFVSVQTVSALCAAFLNQPDLVLRPSYEGKSGHPVLIPAWLDLSAEDNGNGLAGIIRAQVCSVIDLPVDDDAVLRNINYPADLEE